MLISDAVEYVCRTRITVVGSPVTFRRVVGKVELFCIGVYTPVPADVELFLTVSIS